MATAKSLGPIQVSDNSVESLNDAHGQVQERLNALSGLKGPVTVHNTETADAFRVVDEDGQLIHAFGTVT